MKLRTSLAAMAAFIMLPGLATATGPDDFLLETAQDLVDVCSTGPEEMLYVQSIHFCHGFLTGAAHYHRAMSSGPEIDPIFCPPAPQPTRGEAIALYLDWTTTNGDTLGEAPVDNLVRFAVAVWPCE